jgi:hypothetical protein
MTGRSFSVQLRQAASCRARYTRFQRPLCVFSRRDALRLIGRGARFCGRVISAVIWAAQGPRGGDTQAQPQAYEVPIAGPDRPG